MRCEPRFVFLPFVWAAGIALTWLVVCDAWAWPVSLLQLIPLPRLGPHFGAFLRDAIAAMATVVLTMVAAFGVGATMVSRWLTEKNLFNALIALAVGLWVMSVTVLCIGWFSVAATPWALTLGCCWLLPWPREFIRRHNPWVCPSAWEATMLCVFGVAALLNLMGAVTPPFEYDELEYHLGALTEYRRAGRLVFLPHNFYSNLPQLTEMLYLLGSDTAAKLWHWSFGVLTALAIYTLTRRLADRSVAITAATLFYCLPFVQNLSMTARVDLATTFFGTLAFGGLLLGDNKLSALLVGCAIATKWTAIPVIFLPCLAFVLLTGKSLRVATGYWLLATFPVVPWLVKNWLLAGNPIYPLFSQALHWSAEQAALFAQKHFARYDLSSCWQWVESIGRYCFTETDASPLLLLAAPLLLICRQVPLPLRRAAWMFAGAFLGWYLLTYRPWRFLFPAMPLAAMMGAWALGETRWTRSVALLVMLVGLSMMSVTLLTDVGGPNTNPFGYVLGHGTRRDFIARMGGGSFEPIVWMNEHLPSSAKVLYLGEARTHYARHSVVWATAFDRFPSNALEGVTHVYVNFPELKRLREGYGYPRGLDGDVVLARLGREIHRTERGAVFEWKP